jgi:hypothetical protein
MREPHAVPAAFMVMQKTPVEARAQTSSLPSPFTSAKWMLG